MYPPLFSKTLQSTANVYVRVTDRLPAIEEGMFFKGNLIGSFTGPGRDGQTIHIETDSSLSGRYLLIQMDMRAANRSLRYLNLIEVEVIGTLQAGDISNIATQMGSLAKFVRRES